MSAPKDRAHDGRRQANYEKLIGKVAFPLAHPDKEEGPDRNKEAEWNLTMADENNVHESKVQDEHVGEWSDYYNKDR